MQIEFKIAERQTQAVVEAELRSECARNSLLVWLGDPYCLTWNNL